MNIKQSLLAGTVLLLAVAAAHGGIIFVPVGGRVVELGEIDLSATGNPNLTSSLITRLDCPGAPPDETYVEAEQTLALTIDRRSGDVAGTATGILRAFDMASPLLALRARVSGTATCLDRAETGCRRWVLELRADGVLGDLGLPERVGLLRQHLLGSLTAGGGGAQWQGMDLAVTLGGSETFVRGVLDTMGSGDSCGV